MTGPRRFPTDPSAVAATSTAAARLAYYHQRAQELFQAHRAHDLAAAERFATWHPDCLGAHPHQVLIRPLTLGDAQLVVAHEAGFTNWVRFLRYLERAPRLPAPFEAAVDAIMRGDVDLLWRFIQADATLSQQRSDRDHRATLLHYAVSNVVEVERRRASLQGPYLADILIAAGADIHATANVPGPAAVSTPLVGLVTSDLPERANTMVDLVRTFARSRQDLNGSDGDGQPIVWATLARHLAATRALVACGARLDHVVPAAALGRHDLVEQMVEEGSPATADPGPLPTMLERDVTPADTASFALAAGAMAGERAMVRNLLDFGIEPNGSLSEGQTALHEAARSGHLEIVQMLVEAGWIPTQRDRQHTTPLHWAVHARRYGVVRYLLRECDDVDLLDLIELNQVDLLAERFGREPSLVEGPDGDGRLLRHAAAVGHPEIVSTLLAHGADPARPDGEGRTALDWAAGLGRTEVIDLLRNA